MTLIRNLAYVGFGTDDPDGWARFGGEILGLQVVTGQDPTGSLKFRMDERVYRLVAEPGQAGALHFLGFEVADVADLARLRSQLESAGVEVNDLDERTLRSREVRAALTVADPFGNRLEFCAGLGQAPSPFVSPTGARFVTGDLGLGHAFLWVTDIDEFVRFYVDLLGFRLSDTYEVTPGNLGYFLHCSPRHHTLAAMVMPGMPIGLGHIMLEVDRLDTVGYAYDKVTEAGIPIFGTLGRHANDLMLSFYAASPSKFPVEYGVEGRLIDDDVWIPGHYTRITLWGHRQPDGAGE